MDNVLIKNGTLTMYESDAQIRAKSADGKTVHPSGDSQDGICGVPCGRSRQHLQRRLMLHVGVGRAERSGGCLGCPVGRIHGGAAR